LQDASYILVIYGCYFHSTWRSPNRRGSFFIVKIFANEKKRSRKETMVKKCKRWLPSLLILLLVIGLISGCANPGQSANSQVNQVKNNSQVQAGNEVQESDDTDKAGDEQPSSTAPTETPETTKSPSDDKDQDQDKATNNAGDKQATPSPKPVQTNVPKLDDQKTKPTAKPSKTDEAVQTKPVKPVETAQPAQTVTISIVADEETGTVLAPTVVEIKKDDTVLEVLKKITRKNKIQMEYRGAKGAAYIEGIDNIYEFDFGAKSGWMYRVNGEFPNKGAGSYKVKEGDVIEWLYTTDLGEDIGAKFDE